MLMTSICIFLCTLMDTIKKRIAEIQLLQTISAPLSSLVGQMVSRKQAIRRFMLLIQLEYVEITQLSRLLRASNNILILDKV